MLKLENYQEIINKCSHCSYCQATCPVYLEDLLESHVARNRLNLINQVLILRTMPVSQRFREILDRCLLCTNCTQTCSSKVPVDEIIIAARAEVGKGTLGGLKGFVMSKMLKQRGLTGLMSKAGSLAQKIGVAREMPQLASKSFDQIYSGTIPAQGEQRGRVAYFVGCGTNFLYPDTGVAVVEVLTRNGWEVVIPDGQVCCGIPVIAEGDLAAAREMVTANLKVFDLDSVEAVITDCTSCGMMMKEKFSKLLYADDPLQEKAQALAGKIFEVTDFLQQKGLSETPPALDKTFTYHVPCHRGWSPTVADAPRNLLGSLPGAELRELEEPERCCGAAGTFFMQQRELSESIRSHRLEQIEASQADTVITQCPVCRFYLSAGLTSQQVTHPVILLAQAYGTVQP